VPLAAALGPAAQAQTQAQPDPATDPATGSAAGPSDSDLVLVAPTDLSINPTREYRVHSLSVRWDNDGTAAMPFGASDKHYTNGAKIDLAWTPPADWRAPDWWVGTQDSRDEDGRAQDEPAWERFAVGLTLAQHIYTGRVITNPSPPPTDRPYAGYLAFGLYAQRASAQTHDHIQLDLGVVGEWSGAERTQKWIHKTFPTQDTPQGWDDQLANEPVINLSLARTWKTPPSEADGVQFEMLPSVSADLGNAFTRAAFDLTLRVGPSLPNDFGPGRIRGWRDATGTIGNGWGEGRLSWYAYTRMGVRAVARDITLDGNTWKNSRSVGREPFVGELELGVRARYHNFEFGYLINTSTNEFDTQDGPDSYGEFSLTLFF
jgi:lipid A 3-O-deacylase